MSEPSVAALLAIMARLRDPKSGCPWDLAQSFATIAPYTIEEAYEVADAIENADAVENPDAIDAERLKDELGDLLFQVVFHARLAEERGWFGFADVAHAIAEKLTRRHPHIFAEEGLPTDAASLNRRWEEHKADERAAAAKRRGALEAGVLADVPRALPALRRAEKLGKRASRVGFDWSSAADVREKVLEELRELDAACGHAHTVEELGDLLFAVANWARHLRVDAEGALRAANAKFERRFAAMERLARERGLALPALSAAEWDALWREVKAAV
ncbi:MAG TPA: nucleoside triphosphate pyrophosphohydrolase [Steroidobacteraceae bacterium]|nr:nucleoside triphosphate pyrophosphohydrolase [Steroidobacteraceae bacterium]